eukprot:scaffold216649_cov14-Tisochrysis_lutea.AAC.1
MKQGHTNEAMLGLTQKKQGRPYIRNLQIERMAELTLRSTLVDWATSGSRADAQSGPPVVELESSQQPATWKAQLANGSAQCAQLHRHPKARHCFCRGSTCGKCIWKDAASALPSAWLPALEQSGVVRRV